MAFPLSQGSTPERGILPADEWTLICTSVSVAKITNLFKAGQLVWLTYTNITSAAPVGLTIPELWKIPADTAEFENGSGQSNIYCYPVKDDAEIRVQT